jgi:uncharacterized protein YbjT (DUF2867 family)
VARALIVGCGCRGRLLGTQLAAAGWAVRGTSRREQGLGPIREAGIEAELADPERPGTLLDLIGDVAVVYYLLGSAAGSAEELAAIHGPRLESLMERFVDTPVRGVVYEGVGSVDKVLLEGGAEIVRAAGERWRIPFEIATEEFTDHDRWSAEMADSALRVLAPGR